MPQEEALRVLGVKVGVTRQALKRLFVQKAKALHPDVNPSPEAARQFSDLLAAYQALVPLARPESGEPDREDPELDRDYLQYREWAERRRRQRELEEYDRRQSIFKMLILAATLLAAGLGLSRAFDFIALDGFYRRAWGSKYDPMLVDFHEGRLKAELEKEKTRT